MSEEQVVLVVGLEFSTCSHCGLGSAYGKPAHTEVRPWYSANRGTPCGKRFTQTAASNDDPERAANIKLNYPDLPFLGCGEVVMQGGEPTFHLKKPASEYVRG